MNMNTAKCYVCRKSADCEGLVAIQVVSKYSQTPISELIQNLLAAYEPLRFEASDSICSRCLHKFNQYDLARITVQRVEAELRNALLSAHIALKQEPTNDSNFADKVKESVKENDSIIGFERYQQEYDIELVKVEGIERVKDENVSEDEQIEYLDVIEVEDSGDELLEIKSASKGFEEDHRLQESICGSSIRHSFEPEEPDWLERHGITVFVDTNDDTHEQRRSHIRKVSNQRRNVMTQRQRRKKRVPAIAPVLHVRAPQTGTLFQSQTGKIVFRCDICFREELNTNDLRAHIVLHDRKYKCVICASVTSHREYLVHHMRTHADTQISECICPICGVHKPSENALSRHTKTHEMVVATMSLSGDGQTVLRCDFCYHEERNDFDMIAHFALHDSIAKCLLCAKEFKSKIALRSHMLVHQSDRQYHQCDKCGKQFSTLSSMRTHLAGTHTVERKVRCELCPQTFKTSNGLRNHMVTHREKKHKCPECGKCFAVPWNMRVHRRLHLGTSSLSKRHACVICNTTFERPSQLKQHCIRIHSRITARNSMRREC